MESLRTEVLDCIIKTLYSVWIKGNMRERKINFIGSFVF